MDTLKENKMGVLPIPKLVFSMALPMICSMLVQALYNLVDSIFVAQINENALSAVSLVFPIQNLMIALSSGTCVGVNSLLSRRLGEKDYESAYKVAHNGLLLASFTYIIFAAFSLLVCDTFLRIQTDNQQILTYAKQYMTVICAMSFGLFLTMTLERLLQSTGLTHLSMISQISGAVFNLIFDPILIFGLLGFPKLGVAGAALATVLGQILGIFIALFLNIKFNKEIRFSLQSLHFDSKIIKQIYTVGIPSILMMSIGSIMTFCFNKMLLVYTPTATAVFGVYFKLNSLFFMPVFGLNTAIIPIVAYNFGARNPKRIKETYKIAAVVATFFMFIGIILFQFTPEWLLRRFDASADMLSIGTLALRIISVGFLFSGYCIITSGVFQALGKGLYSLIISLTRQLVLLVPIAFLLSSFWGLNAIWWSFPIAEGLTFVVTLVLFRRLYRLKLANLSM